MLKFILNDKDIAADVHPGTTLLDFIRYHRRLMGTKIGCREGDCGACTVLIGEITNNRLEYNTVTSCLMPLGNVTGKHVVTIEGINVNYLTPVQEAFAEEGASQCGFCTPGFIVSLTGYCLSENTPATANAIDSMNGNICRCTGYKSIQRAAERITQLLQQRNTTALSFAIEKQIIPEWFNGIQKRLIKFFLEPGQQVNNTAKKLGGGTDVYVQQHDEMTTQDLQFLYDKKEWKFIEEKNGICAFGASVTVADIARSIVFQQHLPRLNDYIKLVSSTPIRNMATIAGNFVNASPIGDFSIFFLALNAQLTLCNGDLKRELPLRLFYKGYKQLNKDEKEYIEKISFQLPSKKQVFNFEKVSKRTHLDIASVNCAMLVSSENNIIENASIAAGGVGPIPLYLVASSNFLKGKEISLALIKELLHKVNEEISPISDARGSEGYKRLLLAQLIKAHCIKLFPALPENEILFLS